MSNLPVPSADFIAAILRGYRKERETGKLPVTCSRIWDHVCMACLRMPGGFKTMFEWDTRKGDRNRIGTIAEVIQAGHVPGLRVDDKLRVYEVE